MESQDFTFSDICVHCAVYSVNSEIGRIHGRHVVNDATAASCTRKPFHLCIVNVIHEQGDANAIFSLRVQIVFFVDMQRR